MRFYDIMRFWLDKGIDGFRMGFSIYFKTHRFFELPKEIVNL
jgi:glycosidase